MAFWYSEHHNQKNDDDIGFDIFSSFEWYANYNVLNLNINPELVYM